MALVGARAANTGARVSGAPSDQIEKKLRAVG
jgi:hypothetical protein